MYAIIETGGKQYRVTPGDVVSLEKLDGAPGQTVTFDKVLLIGGKADGQALVGTPYLAQASLHGEIVEQSKGEKLLTIKYRRRKGYRRMIGHRQMLTRVLVTKVEDGKGGTAAFDASKRNEVLMKASVPFATKPEKKPAAPKKLAAAPAETAHKAAAPKKAPAEKKTATKKTTTSKKKA
jgi:large subunit ribosomal protein L21